MTASIAGRELRKDKRYRVRENAMALNHSVIGQITNLSRGGLMFRYLADLYNYKGNLAELDVYFAGDGLCLRRVPCATVFNRPADKEVPFSSLTMRECGVKFGSLSAEQEVQLAHILANRTMGEY